MAWIDFESLPLWQNVAVFLVAAVVIWLAGSRLAVYADIIADRTGLGEAFIGLVLLATATSLPEIGRTIGASTLGNAPLAVDSLFGGITLQTAVLAIADLMVAHRVLTYFSPSPVLLLQGAIVVLLLGLAIAGIAAGELIQFFGIGLWTVILMSIYVFSLYTLKRYETREQWRPVHVPEELKADESARIDARGRHGQRSLAQIGLRFGLSCAIIFVAGVLLAQIGEALAVQTGLSAGFVGATLLAFASALPEMSTTIAAVRFGAYSMAIANIFGTNAFLVALLFLSDLFYRQGPVLDSVGRASIFAAAAGIVATSVYLVGLIERRNRRVLGMGFDSAIVLVCYAGTLLVLCLLR